MVRATDVPTRALSPALRRQFAKLNVAGSSASILTSDALSPSSTRHPADAPAISPASPQPPPNTPQDRKDRPPTGSQCLGGRRHRVADHQTVNRQWPSSRVGMMAIVFPELGRSGQRCPPPGMLGCSSPAARQRKPRHPGRQGAEPYQGEGRARQGQPPREPGRSASEA